MSSLVPVAELDAFCREALVRAGANAEHAAIAADALTTTDTWGVFTHGSKLLPGYARRLRAGGISGDAEPRITAEGPAWAILDGGSALGQVVGVCAMDEAIMRARRAGIAATPVLLFTDPPLHTRQRKLVNRAFTLRRVAAIEASIRKIADDLVGQPGEQCGLAGAQ